MITMDDGVRLHVEADPDSGKPPLIFSNSLGTSLAMWDRQFEEAERSFRVIRYDTRGHGRSEAPKGPYSMERLGRDVVGILDALRIEHALFCGLSLGGMTGMWLGTNASSRFPRLALCNTAARMPLPENMRKRAATVRADGMGAIADLVVSIWLTEGFRQRDPDTVSEIRSGLLATSAEGYAYCCEAIADMDQEASIAAISAPTLVVVGSQDQSTPPSRGALLHRSIAGSRLVTLDAAHLSNIEQPAAFNQAVFGFLAG
jgi:3-oxoadipate enol-lactonase